MIFQKIRQLSEKTSQKAQKVHPVAKRVLLETEEETAPAPGHRLHSPGDFPHQRRYGRIRSYAEEEANHDLWVAGLSPQAVACAARDLEPPPRSRWRLRQKERPPTGYEIWRIERHAALLRRMKRDASEGQHRLSPH